MKNPSRLRFLSAFILCSLLLAGCAGIEAPKSIEDFINWREGFTYIEAVTSRFIPSLWLPMAAGLTAAAVSAIMGIIYGLWKYDDPLADSRVANVFAVIFGVGLLLSFGSNAALVTNQALSVETTIDWVIATLGLKLSEAVTTPTFAWIAGFLLVIPQVVTYSIVVQFITSVMVMAFTFKSSKGATYIFMSLLGHAFYLGLFEFLVNMSGGLYQAYGGTPQAAVIRDCFFVGLNIALGPILYYVFPILTTIWMPSVEYSNAFHRAIGNLREEATSSQEGAPIPGNNSATSGNRTFVAAPIPTGDWGNNGGAAGPQGPDIPVDGDFVDVIDEGHRLEVRYPQLEDNGYDEAGPNHDNPTGGNSSGGKGSTPDIPADDASWPEEYYQSSQPPSAEDDEIEPNSSETPDIPGEDRHASEVSRQDMRQAENFLLQTMHESEAQLGD